MEKVRLLAVWLMVLCYSPFVMPGYQPIRSETAEVHFNETGQGRSFPDYNSNSNMCSQRNGDSFFGNELNFAAVPQMIVTGAADELFLLNRELECQHSYSWNTTNANFMACTQAGIEESACRNHIRVYKRIPSQPSVMLVCGTQGGISPLCRTLNVSNNVLSPTTPVSPTTPAVDSLISSYPEFNWFGEFIESTGTSGAADKFFSSGYYRGNRQLGRDLNISFDSVTYTPNTGVLALSRDYSTREDRFWLNLPVTLVDYYRADYGSPANPLYQFYFVFLREVLIDGLEIIYSRVARICRNDPGINGHFSTYMKARIFCEREVPPGRQYNGAVDYHYNEIQSFVFNDDGRIGAGGTWVKMMYGAFSGPTIGPPGTAICAYRADDSVTTGGTGFNRGIFDIFREDLNLVMADGTTAERENTYVECRPGGRTTDFNNVLSVQDVSQIGEDPLVVFDGLIVTKMALDQVCVVTPSNPRQCQNQDVIFLGTDAGKIMKVVFSGSTSFDPIVAEEITLDQSDNDAVKELRIIDDGSSNERYIYAATESKIYRLPLQRCSRLQGCNECITSRDPYCVWNNNTNQVGCQANPLVSSGSSSATVPTHLWQNIHTGSVPECLAAPTCEVTVMAISAQVITCEAVCSNTESITFSSNVPGSDNLQTCGGQSTTAAISGNEGCVQFSGSIGMHSYVCTVEATSTGGSSVNFTNTTITPAGPPICITEQDVIHFPGQRDVTICVNLDVLTDRFENYEFEVDLGGTRRQNFSDGNCLNIENLTPGSREMYRVVVSNSITSSCVPVSIEVNLLEDKPGPVENLSLTPSNVSVSIAWSRPSTTNGIISGYTVSLNETAVTNCAILNSNFTSYTIDGLSPYSDYTIGVKACTTAGEGMPSSMTQRTLCGRPSEIQNLAVVPNQPFDSLTVTWDEPARLNGNPDSDQYVVDYTCYLPNTSVADTGRKMSTLSFTISNLLPLTECCVKVYGENSCNSVTYSGPVVSICGRTSDAQPSSVQNLQITSVSDHSLFIAWEPPTNYTRPGLRYSVEIAGQTFEVLDQTYYFVSTNLQPNTSYRVEVRAISSFGMSTETLALSTTKPQFPSAPRNVRFSAEQVNNINQPVLAWDAASDVTNYIVFWRCNELSGNYTTSTTSTTIPTPSSLEDEYTWCTARVQSVNEIGVSNLSDSSSVVVPQLLPQAPTCFLVDNKGSSAVFSFTVTDAFSLHQLKVDWKLNTSSTNTESSMNSTFMNNTLSIPVRRNTDYLFSLRLCNLQGCSNYCTTIMFTTNTDPPQAPTNVIATNVASDSVQISWNQPANENPDNIVYTFEVTSSCPSGNILKEGFTRSTILLPNLCGGKLYSFVVQATDKANNVTGPLSRAFTFRTAEGIPSPPPSIQSEIIENTLYIHWIQPDPLNGNLTHYEGFWRINIMIDCNKAYKTCILDNNCFIARSQINQYNVTVANPSSVKSISVCVRAYTSAGPGEWASFYDGTVTTGALGGVDKEDDCNGLIVVAVIASFAVVSSITIGIILAVLIYKTRESLCEHSKNDRFKGNSLPPSYDRTASMQSTKSLISHNEK